MTGEQLYDLYREERIRQGWQEFLWKSIRKPQQLVWTEWRNDFKNFVVQTPKAKTTLPPNARYPRSVLLR